MRRWNSSIYAGLEKQIIMSEFRFCWKEHCREAEQKKKVLEDGYFIALLSIFVIKKNILIFIVLLSVFL